MKRIHLTAIGGAIMHNLAIALHRKGYNVSGSDDAIYDPARSNLEKEGLLPAVGWDASKIDSSIDVVILGMHARPDNPELLKAKELGIPIVSFPEFIASEAEDKTRLVVAGSHGKTTTTAMIMHALSRLGVDFDYLVGSSLDGFDLSVRLSGAPLIVIEGDEYLSSPLDRRSKFMWYKPHVSIITGVAYDHINVFPTFESYVQTFDDFLQDHHESGICFWFAEDEHLQKLSKTASVNNQAYTTPSYEVVNGNNTLFYNGNSYPLQIVGKHNMQNLEAAALACERIGVNKHDFFEAMMDFEGAGRRMEKVFDVNGQVVYRDFAHSPSKLKATTSAVKEAYDGRLTAVFELHTFSSLNSDFLPYYNKAMEAADQAFVFYNESVFAFRKMKPLDRNEVANAFEKVEVINDVERLEEVVKKAFNNGDNLLLMSSGKFDGANFDFITS